MRFTQGGPDIPDALVLAQERGDVIFVCGAGVSMTAGLPSFASLVNGVYSRLGEDWSQHHAEREVMASDGRMSGQFDRVLRCLERRLEANDVRQASGMRRRIRDAVAEQLRPAAGADLSNHLALLELARGPDNVSKLLTTNFDCLFERAWQTAGRRGLASHAGSSMPRQGTAAFEGVLHLHGRIADAGLVETELVLTSAEFGEAYLRSGWATRYVYDLVRAQTLVLVGYQADDPPMRYLLEVLEDDRGRYPDLRQVFAFAPASVGSEGMEHAMWAAKGIESIPYASSSPSDHATLYSSLRAWRDYSVAPGRWRKARLSELLASPPKNSPATTEIVSLLSRQDAPDLLRELAPRASWWPVLSTHSDLRERANALGAWVAARASDPDMLRACVADRPFDARVFDGVLWAVNQKSSSAPTEVARGWRLLARAVAGTPSHGHDFAWYSAFERVQRSDIDHAVRDVVVDAIRPRLMVGRVLEWPGMKPPTDPPECFRVSFEVPGHLKMSEILRVWPDDTQEEAALLRLADRVLADALDQALDAGYRSGFDWVNASVRSLTGPAGPVESGFAPLARLVVSLWDRIARKEPRLARRLATGWNDDLHPLRQRKFLHALAATGVFEAAEVWEMLSRMDDASFWTGGGERELSEVLAARWPDLSSENRYELEARILGGPPRHLFLEDAGETMFDLLKDYLVFRRLEPIRQAGHALSDATDQTLEDLIRRSPDGSLTLSRDEVEQSIASFLDTSDQPDRLDGVSDNDLILEALRTATDEWGLADGTWRLLCSADPLRAYRGVVAASVQDQSRPDVLIPLLSAACDSDVDGLQDGVAGLLCGLPREALSGNVAASAASWIWQRGNKAAKGTGMPDPMLQVWDQLSDLVFHPGYSGEETQSEVTVDEALNAAGGLMSLALLAWIGKPDWALAQGFPPPTLKRLDCLGSAPGRAGLQARVLLVRDLAFLHDVDPAWTERVLVPRLSWTDPEASSLWLARAGRPTGRAALFNVLKPAYLEAIRRADDARDRVNGLAVRLVELARRKLDPAAEEYQLEWTEVRTTLALAIPAVRWAASWALWRWAAKQEDGVDPADRWRASIGPLFDHIWPLDAAARDERTARNLLLMAVECGDAFPEAVAAIEDFIVPFRITTIDSWLGLEEKHREVTAAHPDAFLRLLDKAFGPRPETVPADLRSVLDRCIASDPSIRSKPAFSRLDSLASRGRG